MASQNSRIRGDADDPGVGPGLVVANSQTYDPPSRYITVSTAGTLTGQLVGDTGDVAYVLPAGTHKLAFKSCTTITSLVAFISR
jgi:hypothetical protein